MAFHRCWIPCANDSHQQETSMTLCPIAVVVGCRKCPAFRVCPLKGALGDTQKIADKNSETTRPDKRAANSQGKAAQK